MTASATSAHEVRYDSADPSTVVLAVRGGLLGRRVRLFSASEVAHVVPQAERLWLRTSASCLGDHGATS
jgi:hypothetical protein